MLRRGDLLDGDLTEGIIGAFFEVYSELDYGFVESVYMRAMTRELYDRGYRVACEKAVPIFYKSHHLCTHRLDMLVNDRVILEIKGGPALPKTAIRQLHNYLKATGIQVGLVLHFGPEAKFYRQFVPATGTIDRTTESRASVSAPANP